MALSWAITWHFCVNCFTEIENKKECPNCECKEKKIFYLGQDGVFDMYEKRKIYVRQQKLNKILSVNIS